MTFIELRNLSGEWVLINLDRVMTCHVSWRTPEHTTIWFGPKESTDFPIQYEYLREQIKTMGLPLRRIGS